MFQPCHPLKIVLCPRLRCCVEAILEKKKIIIIYQIVKYSNSLLNKRTSSPSRYRRYLLHNRDIKYNLYEKLCRAVQLHTLSVFVVKLPEFHCIFGKSLPWSAYIFFFFDNMNVIQIISLKTFGYLGFFNLLIKMYWVLLSIIKKKEKEKKDTD